MVLGYGTLAHGAQTAATDMVLISIQAGNTHTLLIPQTRIDPEHNEEDRCRATLQAVEENKAHWLETWSGALQ